MEGYAACAAGYDGCGSEREVDGVRRTGWGLVKNWEVRKVRSVLEGGRRDRERDLGGGGGHFGWWEVVWRVVVVVVVVFPDGVDRFDRYLVINRMGKF